MLPPRPPLAGMSGSEQREEEIFSVIKKSNIVRRRASLMAVKEEVDRRVEDLRLESRL